MSSAGVNLETYLIPLEEIKLATQNFSQNNKIGEGGFGVVYKGQLSERWQNRTAAIKRLDPDGYQGEHEFHNELEMISRFHHQNIISFIGYCDQVNEMILVYEYAGNGSLDCHLYDQDKRRRLTWEQRLKICLGVARGLNYLHSGLGEESRVIHRDVKSGNILLDENLEAKICDFGLSRQGIKNQPFTQVYTEAAGTNFYMDPIYNESGILSKESDVYSFGVVLFEMFSGMLAYHAKSFEDGQRRQTLINLVRRYYSDGLNKLIDPLIRDQINKDSFDAYKEIAYQCLNYELNKRPTVDEIICSIEDALNVQVLDIAPLIECVKEDLGFSEGKPVAAFTIYKCLLHSKYLEAERTRVFDRVMQVILSASENQDDINQMAYWLSNTATLLFLLQKSLKPPNGLRSYTPSVNLSKSVAGLEVVPQIEAKYPALLFQQQLAAYVDKFFGIIRDNLKNKLGPLLTLCIEVPRTSKEVLRSGQSFGKDSQSNHWQSIVDCLNTLLDTLKENCVPPKIVRKIYTQTYSYINMQLFNSLLLYWECCTLSNGEYVKAGLAELELWCSQAKEYAGTAWYELQYIRQAIGLLVIHQKHTLSFDEIRKDLCPALSMQQLYRICTVYWDDDYNTQSVSPDVISSMRTLMTSSSYVKSMDNTKYLLDDESSIPFDCDEIRYSMELKDFANVKPAVELSKYPAFHFLYD